MRNPWLDACRALAIALVLLGHARLFVRAAFPSLDALKAGSFLGVELFFVLSGFLIGGILLDAAAEGRPGWLRNFFARRWWRTLPNYYLFLVVNVVLALVAIRPADLTGIGAYLIFMQSLAWPHPSFFGEAWSLAIEEVFYFAFPLSFLLVARLSGAPLARALLLVAVAVILLSPLARGIFAEGGAAWDEAVRKPVAFRLDAIMYGVLLAWVARMRSSWLRPVAWRVFAFGALAFAFWFVATKADPALDSSSFARTWLFCVTSFGCAGLIAAGLHWPLPAALARAAGFGARISYAAYLANIPVALVLLHVWPFANDGPTVQIARAMAFLLLTVLVSWAVHRGFELRFLRLRERLAPAPHRQGAMA